MIKELKSDEKMTHLEKTKHIAAQWNQLSDKDKASYIELAQKDKIRYFEQNDKIKKSSPQGSQKSLPKSQSSGSKAAKNAQKPPATPDSASGSSRSSKSDKNSEKSDSMASQEAIKPAKSAYQFFWDVKYEPYKEKFSHLNSAEITEIVNDEWQDIQRKPAKWPFNKLMKEDAE